MNTSSKVTHIVALAVLSLVCGNASGSEFHVHCENKDWDAARLNEAIRESRPGDLVQIHGACLLRETVILRGDRAYQGDSRTGTILRQARHANLPALMVSDGWYADTVYTGEPIRLEHLTLDGNKAENSFTNGLVIRSWQTVIDDLLVENTPGDGIQITNLSRNGVELTTTQVNGRISNVFVTGSGGDGIHVVDTGNSVTDWNLLDSWVAYSGKSAINLENAAGWTVRGNHVYGVQQNALYANRCFATAIDQNYIEDFGGAGGSDTWFGIACTVQGGAASVISGNRVFMFAPEAVSARFVYIGVPTVNYGTGQINVTGNSIRGAGGTNDIGLDYQLGAGEGLNLLSSGNNVQAVHTDRVIGAGVKPATSY
jgi:hypothetical protein